jgi:hypothetical protein
MLGRMPSLAATAAALALAALPQHGVLVPDVSLGGLRLGMTPAQVRAAWGEAFARCRGCSDPTWYYTYRRFAPQGGGVAFRQGRVVAVFTLWAPPGWRSTRGLAIGDPEARVTALYGALLRVHCGSYDAFVRAGKTSQTAFYVYGGKVWGFGLSSAAVPACR